MPTWTAENDRRLLLVLVAVNPGIKYDFDKIAEVYGGTTKNSVNHRFRVLRKEVKQLLADVENGVVPPVPEVRKRASAPNTPSKSRKRSRPLKEEDEDSD